MGILEDVKKGFLFADGGMGTMLQDSGLKPGELPETWNEIHADIIQDVHYKYLCAGADYLTTNSFGANSLKFADTQVLKKYITLAVQNAKAAISCGKMRTTAKVQVADVMLLKDQKSEIEI